MSRFVAHALHGWVVTCRYLVPVLPFCALLVACGGDRDDADSGVTGITSGSGGGSGTDGGDGDGDGDGDAGGDAGGDSGGDGDGDGDGDSGGDGDGDGDSGGDGDGDGDSGGIRLDVGDGESSGGGAEGGSCDPDVDEDCGCTAVDILFVVDDSTSMGSYQSTLAAAAPTFGAAIFDSLPPGTDVHVGVTNTDFLPAGFSGGTSPGEQNCAPYYAGAGMTGRDDLYTYYQTPDMGSNNEDGAQGRLSQHQGMTYFEANSNDDPAPMTNWLTGAITSQGERGSVWEMATAGAAYPFHPANATANAGFLRDEGAVLVLFILTDEVGNSPEDVAVYHDMVVAAKQQCGGDRCVVTGGIMNPCLVTATDTRIYPFLSSFGKDPVIGDIDGDPNAFGDILSNTLTQVIAQTCDEIPPPVG